MGTVWSLDPMGLSQLQVSSDTFEISSCDGAITDEHVGKSWWLSILTEMYEIYCVLLADIMIYSNNIHENIQYSNIYNINTWYLFGLKSFRSSQHWNYYVPASWPMDVNVDAWDMHEWLFHQGCNRWLRSCKLALSNGPYLNLITIVGGFNPSERYEWNLGIFTKLVFFPLSGTMNIFETTTLVSMYITFKRYLTAATKKGDSHLTCCYSVSLFFFAYHLVIIQHSHLNIPTIGRTLYIPYKPKPKPPPTVYKSPEGCKRSTLRELRNLKEDSFSHRIHGHGRYILLKFGWCLLMVDV